MFRALTRTTLLVVAPSTPVAWSPGAAPLSDSLRARVLAGAGSAAVRAVAVMPTSGRRVVSVPVGQQRDAARPAVPSAARIAVPVQRPAESMVAPWGEPDPVKGVVMRTSLVPAHWLRPTAVPPPARPVVAPEPAMAPRSHAPVVTIPVRPDVRPVPASVRIRKAAMMAFGVLVSLVAVEAAARVGRR